MAVSKDQGAKGVVFEDRGWFIQEVNVGVAHILVFSNTQHLLDDGATKEVLVHQGHMVSEEGHQFNHQVCGVLEGCASESLMQQVDSSVLKLFCNFDMDGFENLAFGLTWERGSCRGSPSDRSEGFRFFNPSQMVL